MSILPPTGVRVFDTPYDAGGSITVRWEPSKDDSIIQGYIIERSESPDTGFVAIGRISHGQDEFTDNTAEDGKTYYYRVRSRRGEKISPPSSVSNPIRSSPQWFHLGKINVLLGIVIFTAFLFYFISRAKAGKRLFIRKIAGLDALDEAVGRATEMGRPILFVPGLSSMTDVATIAAMNILGEVAKTAARYETPLIVPNCDPIVMTVAQEVVKEAYTTAGHPEAYNPDRVFFLSSSQFAFAAGIGGIMMREKPATNLFMGMFYAESLILAETGAATGAIQIAGTDAAMQLPFFVTACDYTLMGEEFYAASAYLSGEPILVGSIKAQDYSKLILLVLSLLGPLLYFYFRLEIIKSLFAIAR
ncbi:MAG TPA: fibronectin type III domain-containing protein [bacterium (Candidatus Stahlbacteria)]|nr:fibronectin type III domain-containing protein [Candidatus Stahlbacteria bacterium]